MERCNVIGVASGPMDVVRRWRAAAPNRIIPAAASAGEVPLDSIRVWAANGSIQFLGELMFQYAGLASTDSIPEAYYAHPQVYVDVGVISWVLPRKEFHRYLQRLVEAGFGKRVMFGSDEMLWPQSLRIAIEAVETASFLTPSQKRDIFYNNAARV